jgi:hypothetical protein
MPKKSHPIQHRVPTPATLKELYANAYHCAFPNCTRPLYKVDSESGIRTLNSNASHICARSEGGPRWDNNQSEFENRSVNNLLALCLEHANEIDDLKKTIQYPKEKLLVWKKQQITDFDALGKQGWSIRDEDIKKLTQHFNIVENAISHSIIDLGGKGGNAPGAGGGGGGVFESFNSKAGDGGKGGNTIILRGTDATAPGAGGGGAGVLGEGAVASEGGGGGEMVEALVLANTFDSIEFQIGEGGKGGKDGGDTIVKFIKDGQVTKVISAKGGKAGNAGQHGDISALARLLTKADLQAGSGISTIMLTEFWRFKNGLVTLLDANWEAYKVPSFPYTVEWPLFLVFSVVGLETPTVIDCAVRIRNAENSILIEQKILFSKLNDVTFRIPWTQIFTFELTKEGIWTIEVVSGEMIIATLPIAVSS